MAEDDETVQRMVTELVACDPIGVMFQPVSLFHLVALVQLALRHPHLSEASRHAGERFVEAAQVEYFTVCPTVQTVIERGNDRTQDKPRGGG